MQNQTDHEGATGSWPKVIWLTDSSQMTAFQSMLKETFGQCDSLLYPLQKFL